MLRSSWSPGPAGDAPDGGAANDAGSGTRGHRSGPLIVSVTDFTSETYRALPGIARRGFALRRHWPHLDGAVGMWLWVMPTARRCGSVSVWTGRRALAGFVRLPEHVAIMDEYRGRGTMRSVLLEYDGFDAARILRDAEAWLLPEGRERVAQA
ncbi:hypothetical protein GCM10023086_60740 [Streptomyces venetus]|uniref:DUF3291 domain-containing protein n=1 Tax=Streptomyces venetus TaxID=1701086 RepID=A0ABP8GW45_9ACTN